MRCAAIDIGTVTCRLLIADVVNGQLTEILRRCEITNLGIGVDATSRLQHEAVERVVMQVSEYLALVDQYSVCTHPSEQSARYDCGQRVWQATQQSARYDYGRSCAQHLERMPVFAIATSAARDAVNANELIEPLENLGVHLLVIPGQQEATLSFKGASSCFPDEMLLVVDIGGGSTELVFGFAGREPLFSHSFNLGCRRLTERFLHSDPPLLSELNEVKSFVKLSLLPFIQDCLRSLPLPLVRVVAVAGTATSAVSIRKGMVEYRVEEVHKSVVSYESLHAIGAALAAKPLVLREKVVGLEPKRASVIVAGMLVLEAILELVDKDSFTVSESDILQGILLDESSRFL